MYFRQWGPRLALAALVFAGALACRTANVFIAQATLTPTRTPRPTFTPLPSPTATPLPIPTNPPVPTRSPTRRPTPRPTPRPTQPPAPTARPQPQPTAFPWVYHANPARCEHSGMTFIKGAVYSNVNDPNSKTPGVRVSFGAADGTTTWGTVTTDGNGEYTFLLNASGAKPGTFYVWVVDGSGNRISQIGGPINTNSLGADAPGSCWNGSVDFWK